MQTSKKEKLRRLIRPKKPEPAMIDCLNCGGSVNGSYCAQCGQAVDVKRYTTKGMLRELATHFRKFEGAKTLQTFWALFHHPGRFVREFLAGQRVDYLGPIKYFLLAFLLQATAGLIIHSITGSDVSILVEGSDFRSQVIDLVATVFWGISWWLIYRHSDLNITENIVAAMYFTAQTFMFTLLLRLALGPFMSASPTSSSILLVTDLAIYLGYSFHFAHRLFRETGWRLVLKQLALTAIFIAILFAIVLAMTVAKATVGPISAPAN